jgi:hypothetical protein
VASRWRGRHFVSFGHQRNGGFKAAPNGSSSFGLAVAKRRRVPRSFGFGLRYGSLSPLSFSDWALHLSPWLRPAGLAQRRPVLELYPLDTERVRPVRFIGEPVGQHRLRGFPLEEEVDRLTASAVTRAIENGLITLGDVSGPRDSGKPRVVRSSCRGSRLRKPSPVRRPLERCLLYGEANG